MKSEDADVLNRITSNADILNGKPIIRGLRFKVSDVLGNISNKK